MSSWDTGTISKDYKILIQKLRIEKNGVLRKRGLKVDFLTSLNNNNTDDF